MDLKTFQSLLDARGLSQNTIDKYSKYVKDFNRFVTLRKGLSSTRQLRGFDVATVTDVQDYLIHLRKDRGLTTATTCLALSAIKTFLRVGRARNPQFRELLARVEEECPRPKIAYKEAVVLTDDEIKKVFDYLKQRVRKALHLSRKELFISLRNLAMISLLYTTGIRLSELLAMNRDSIRNGLLEIRSTEGFGPKGGKERVVPIPPLTLKRIEKYLSLRKDQSKALWTSMSGKRLTPEAVRHLVIHTYKKSGVYKPGMSVHTLRHTFTTHALRDGEKPVHLQKILGHTTLGPLTKYEHLVAKDIIESMRRMRHTEKI